MKLYLAQSGEGQRALRALSKLSLALALTLASANFLFAQQSSQPHAAFGAADADAKPVVDVKHARQSYLRGRENEKATDWRAAYEAYSEAVLQDPGNKEYQLRQAIARSRLVQDYV